MATKVGTKRKLYGNCKQIIIIDQQVTNDYRGGPRNCGSTLSLPSQSRVGGSWENRKKHIAV